MRARALLALVPVLLALLGAERAAAAGAPSIAASWVEDVTATGALLRAEVDPDGIAGTGRFEYLTEAAYEAAGGTFAGAASTPAVSLGSGSSAVPLLRILAGLAPATAYRYRVVATNADGTTTGAEHVLSTEEPTNVHPPIDGRGWEMVSPPDKGGGAVGAPGSVFGGGDFQAAAGGESVTYSSISSFAGGAGAPGASQYLSTRGAAGWSTENVTEPALSGDYGEHPDGVPYRVFSEDLARAVLLDGRRCAPEAPCPRGYSLRQSAGGALTALPAEAAGMRLLGASPDLSRVLFEGTGGEVFAWSGGGLSPVDLLPPGAGAGALFQTASADGRITFYTEGGDLHRYDATSGVDADLTPGGGVVGVLGASAAGDVVYYQDGAGLERWQSGGGTTTLVSGAAVAAPGDYPPATGTARVSADGAHLVFLSAAAIPPFDNTDADTGESDTELYLYGPPPGGGAARLLCASCNPTGERPHGSAQIPGAELNGTTAVYKPRVLSASGNRVFFDSADKLLGADTDSRPDVYEWEAAGEGSCTRAPGCLGLVSGARAGGGRFVDASSSGEDVFFVTEESLVPSDPGSIDIYDFRQGGGFPESEQPIPCIGDACQALPSPPEDPTPGTLVPTSGNPPPKVEKLGRHNRRACPEGKHRVPGRKGRSRCVEKTRHAHHHKRRAHR